MIGKTFNRLTVLEQLPKTRERTMLRCLCSCGNERIIDKSDVKMGRTKSCGCLAKEMLQLIKTKHGLSKTKTWRAWSNMKLRCSVKNKITGEYYYGKGISVCDRWLDSFETFLKDMGEVPFAGAQLDRIDNNGNYEPSNCRWVTVTRNCRNKGNNINITFNSETLCISQWSARFGISIQTISARLKSGWETGRALTQRPR